LISSAKSSALRLRLNMLCLLCLQPAVRLQNQQVQRSLYQGNTLAVIRLGSHSTQVLTRLGRMSTQEMKQSLDYPLPCCSAALVFSTLAEDDSMLYT